MPHAHGVIAQLAGVVDALPEALLLLARDGTVRHANAAALRLFGGAGAELVGRRLGDGVRDTPEHVEALLRGCARSRSLMPGALTLRSGPDRTQGRLRCDGAVVHREADGADVVLLLRLQPHAGSVDRFVELNRRIDELTREIARRQAAERDRDEQREWLRVALRSLGEAVIATDIDGLVNFMNPAAELLTGWREADARGLPVERVARFLADDEPPTRAHPVRVALAELRPVPLDGGPASLWRRDGSACMVDDMAAPIVDDAGRLLGAVLVCRDMSERLAAEARRRSLEGQLRDAQKMQAIGTLAGGIAHDFNNVLGSILGNTSLASDELPPGHAVRDRIAQIDVAARRARRLVKQILAFSRREPQSLQVQPLQPLVEEAVALLRSTVPAGVAIEAVLPEAPLFAQADATRLHQVLMNLGTNAWHAMRAGHGRIEFGLAAVDDARHAPDARPPGRCARLWVADDGCGMDATTCQRMFEPFFTTKVLNEGTGLGLSVVHGIVADHQGSIEVESAPGAGTTVSVYLPLADMAAPEAVRPDGAAPAAAGRGEHVLYVDDDPVMLVTVEALLQRAGYRVSAFEDASTALAAVQARPDAFDLAITDYNMPQLSGLELARAIRGANRSLPLIIASGYIAPELRAQARSLGDCSLLNKEDLSDEIAAAVAGALARAAAALDAR